MKYDCKDCGAAQSVVLTKVARHGIVLKVVGAFFYLIAILSFIVIGYYAMVGWGAVLLGSVGLSQLLSIVIGFFSGLAASLLPIFIGYELTGSKNKYKCNKCLVIFDRNEYGTSRKKTKSDENVIDT